MRGVRKKWIVSGSPVMRGPPQSEKRPKRPNARNETRRVGGAVGNLNLKTSEAEGSLDDLTGHQP